MQLRYADEYVQLRECPLVTVGTLIKVGFSRTRHVSTFRVSLNYFTTVARYSAEGDMPVRVTLRTKKEFSPFRTLLRKLIELPDGDSVILCSGYIQEVDAQQQPRA